MLRRKHFLERPKQRKQESQKRSGDVFRQESQHRRLRRRRRGRLYYSSVSLLLSVVVMEIILLRCRRHYDVISAPMLLKGEPQPPRPHHGATFPRWHENGIWIDPLIDYMEGIVVSDRRGLFRHSTGFPDTPYKINASGVYTNHQVVKRPSEARRKDRWDVSHLMYYTAWETLMRNSTASSGRWPWLHRTLVGTPNSNTTTASIPFVAWYGDNRKCNYNNYKYSYTQQNDGEEQVVTINTSVPVFTMCAPVGSYCNATFPIPTYETFRFSQSTEAAWQKDVFPVQAQKYPWSTKQRQIGWRGSILLTDPERARASVRWRLLEKVHRSRRGLDIRATRMATKDISPQQQEELLGGLASRIDLADFQKYMAVVDMDGLSWSSRFSILLCYSSVVIKVEPEFVDYYHYDLQAWKHYIPVRADLSDWDEVVEFVLDPRNEGQLQGIVAAANAWCQSRFVDSVLAEDLLDIWEAYVRLLYQKNPNWVQVWREKEEQLHLDLDVNLYIHQLYPYLDEEVQ